ncbi:MAG: glycosyltransferase [Bacteroidia bacterium]
MPYYQIDQWFYVIAAVVALHLIYILLFFRRIASFKSQELSAQKKQGVSVIIVAKNEKVNLEKLVPAVLEQDYENFELIIVDDQSWDGTHEWMHDLLPKHKNLKLLTLDDNVNHKPGKKLALTLGIKKAQYDIVLLTDADCLPTSKNWLAYMAQSFDDNTDVVLGYSPYSTSKNVLNPFVRFEGFWVAWQYFSFALFGAPYMGVGRNLAYRKNVFLANKGFASNLHIPFGDDDLLIQEIANSKNTKVVMHKDAHVITEPKKALGSWGKQKRRHLSAGKHYNFKFKALLGSVWLIKVLYFISLAIYLFMGQYNVLTLCLSAMPILAYWVIAIVANHKHGLFNLWYLFPLLDLLYQIVLYPIFGLVAALHPQKNNW